MGEAEAIARAATPRTRRSLVEELRGLGLQAGMPILVHSSLSALGYVCGGPVAVIQALQDVLTPAGTLVMPTHSGDYSDPARWSNPPVPPQWVPIVRDTMPAFDSRITPTRGMGAIPEAFRRWPDVLRSGHPNTSFAAWGAHAASITADHRLESGLGEHSPLARLYDLEGWVLLLGVGHDSNTSFHLAEYRTPGSPTVEVGAPILESGRRVWRWYTDIDFDEGPFAALGADFEQQGHARLGAVGSATARLFRQRAAVDYAVAWLGARRDLLTPPQSRGR